MSASGLLKDYPLKIQLRVLQIYDRREGGTRFGYTYQDILKAIERPNNRQVLDLHMFLGWATTTEKFFIWDNVCFGSFDGFYNFWEERGGLPL